MGDENTIILLTFKIETDHNNQHQRSDIELLHTGIKNVLLINPDVSWDKRIRKKENENSAK